MAYRASIIRSIQRGTISLSGATSNTATITSVDLTSACLNFVCVSATTSTANSERAAVRMTLTNATTITATKDTATDTAVIGYEVIEYWPGIVRSVQFGTIALANGVSTNTATVTSVTTGKSVLGYLGHTLDGTAAGTLTPASMMARLTLTNATTVTAARTASTGLVTVGFQVVEFK